MLEAKRVSCTGSVETVSGSPSLSIIEIGEDLDGAYRLETTITVGRGTAKASVTDVDDERVGGEVSPGEPLEIGAIVYPEPAAGTDEDEEQVEVQLEVKEGEELNLHRHPCGRLRVAALLLSAYAIIAVDHMIGDDVLTTG